MADLNDIINTLIAEANGEGDEGMRRVAETILNRAAIRGLTPGEVVRQPNQYTGYYAPGPAALAAQQDPRVRSAAQAAWELARQPGDPTGGADHYHADYVDPYWANSMPSTGSYGQHKFYASQNVPADALERLLTSRVAPVPQTPPARGNVPSDLISQSFAAIPQPKASGLSQSTVKSISDMFAEPVRDVTPRMSRDGGVTDPAQIVFGSQMATDIFSRPAPKGSATASSAGTASNRPTASDPIEAMPRYSDLASMFGNTSVPGPNGYINPNKDQERLAETKGPYASMPGTRWFDAPTPRPRSEAEIARAAQKPAMMEITEQVLNPDWTANLNASKVPVGMPLNPGSRDSVAQRAAGIKAAQAIPKYIAQVRQVPVPQAPAPVPRPAAQAPRPAAPAQRPTPPLNILVEGSRPAARQSAVQAIRASEGVSAQRAYDLANERAAEKARQNSGPSGYSNIMSGGKRYDAASGSWV